MYSTKIFKLDEKQMRDYVKGLVNIDINYYFKLEYNDCNENQNVCKKVNNVGITKLLDLCDR